MFNECDCHAKAISNRAKELKNLIEVDHPKAISNIERNQIQQKKDQNKQHL